MSSIPLSNEKISFTASLQEGWSGGQGSGDKSRAVKPDFPGLAREQKVLTTDEAFSKPLYLHPIETVNKTLKNQGPTTRGTMNNSSVVDNFGVSANYIQNEGGAEQSFFQNKEAKKEGSNWFVADNAKWPAAGKVSFYAYAPYKDASFTLNDNNKTIHYEVPTKVEDQPDFIVAKSEGKSFSSSSANTPVDLQFSHALTAITFSVSDDMEKGVINSIKIEGVKGEGDYNLSTKEWSVSSSSAASYNVPISARGLNVGTGTVNLAANATLMMIPQTLGDGAKVTINITPTDKSAVDLTFDLKDTKWVAGNHVTYLLSTTKIIKLNMGSVTYPQWQTAEGSAFTSEKLKNSYANGDELGMYIVDKNHKVVKANVQLTTTDGKKWNFSSLQKFNGSLSYDYFLYYPYQEGVLPGAPNEGDVVSVKPGTNQISASDFFSGAIAEWGKKFDTSSGNIIDQSDPKKMNSFDLQIGKADDLGESGTTINFSSMTHAMGLAHVKLGKRSLSSGVTYISKNDFGPSIDPYTWEDKIAYASSEVVGRKLFPLAKYDYACIVSPGISTEFNTASGVKNAWEKALVFTPSTNNVQMLEALVADTGSGSTEYYTIQLGDIFFNDGSITHDLKDVEISEDHCPVGIVVYLAENNDGKDKWAETNTAGSGIGGHGLVMSLKNAGSTKSDSRNDFMKNYQWWKSASGNQTGLQSTNFSDYLNSQTTELGSGYLVSKKIGTDSPAVDAAITYKPSYNSFTAISLIENAQSKTTGWFLSSVGQFIAVLDATNGGINKSTLGWNVSLSNLNNDTNVTNKINDYLWKAAGAKDINEASANYTYFGYETISQFWCTGELNAYNAVSVACVSRGKGTVFFTYPKNTYGNAKTYAESIRPFLAF